MHWPSGSLVTREHSNDISDSATTRRGCKKKESFDRPTRQKERHAALCLAGLMTLKLAHDAGTRKGLSKI